MNLLLLPEPLLFKVFRKLPNLEIIRLRKASSQLDRFAEIYREHLAARPLKIDAFLRLTSLENGEIEVSLKVLGVEEAKKKSFLVGSDFEKKISAMSYSNLQIEMTKSRKLETYQKMMETLERLHPTCESFGLYRNIPTYFLVKMVASVKTRNLVHFGDNLIKRGEQLKKLSENWNSHKYFLPIDTVDSIEFDVIKKFHVFRVYSCKESDLYKLLWEIHHSEDCGNIEWISLRVKDLHELRTDIPAMETICDFSQPPHKSINREPGAIYKMNLKPKCAIFFHKMDPRGGIFYECSMGKNEERIYFVNNTPADVFDFLQKTLNVTSDFKEMRTEFLEATDERRGQILQNIPFKYASLPKNGHSVKPNRP